MPGGSPAGGALSRCISDFPVSTKCGSQPAAAPATASRTESPTAGTPASCTPKRRPICSNRPGFGLRQRQSSSAVCGQKNTASMRPPCIASSFCILACMALSDTTSNSPRPSPDWLEATTTCQPAWFSRAMASSAPGSGSHSSGDLTNSSLSLLMVPSRSRMISFMGF